VASSTLFGDVEWETAFSAADVGGGWSAFPASPDRMQAP
jgi:hypothetical protein